MNRWEKDLGLDTNEQKNASWSQFIAPGVEIGIAVHHQRFPFHCSRRKVAKIQRGERKKTIIFEARRVIYRKVFLSVNIDLKKVLKGSITL